MIATAPSTSVVQPRYIPPLENGDHLGASEFLRRYEQMPEVRKAELIDGVVYMASPVTIDKHAEPDGLIQGWLCVYAAATPGVKHATNATVYLSVDDVVQPDGLLRLLPERGGQARLNAKGYLQGPPELVVEVAASTASIDARNKLHSYRRAGVREYVLWRTDDAALDWWVLDEDEYKTLPADADGIFRCRVFPGLWLDARALLVGEAATVLKKLEEGLSGEAHATFIRTLEKTKT